MNSTLENPDLTGGGFRPFLPLDLIHKRFIKQQAQSFNTLL
jgi:hypothetical protein